MCNQTEFYKDMDDWERTQSRKRTQAKEEDGSAMEKFVVHISIQRITKDEPKKTCRCTGSCHHDVIPGGVERGKDTLVSLTATSDDPQRAIKKAHAYLDVESEDIQAAKDAANPNKAAKPTYERGI